MSSREDSHRTLIQIVARKIGHHHKPQDYIQRIKDEYDVEVSNSSVTKAIGSLYSRLRADEERAIGHAKNLLDACYHDSGLALFWLAKAKFR